MEPNAVSAEPRLGDVKWLAAYLGISESSVWRMENSEYLPRGLRLLGGLVRWDRKVIEKWVEEGCPRCKTK
jgi:predicted DNA-binding transcriptional regulator AlpA